MIVSVIVDIGFTQDDVSSTALSFSGIPTDPLGLLTVVEEIREALGCVVELDAVVTAAVETGAMRIRVEEMSKLEVKTRGRVIMVRAAATADGSSRPPARKTAPRSASINCNSVHSKGTCDKGIAEFVKVPFVVSTCLLISLA